MADVRERALQIEAGVEPSCVERGRHLGVDSKELPKRALFAPSLHRVALHDAIRLVARAARFDERQQYRLAEHETERGIEVSQHALGMNLQVLDDLAELHEHVVGEHERVGNDDALNRRVRDVALVPQGDVFERGLEVAAQHAGQAAHLLRLDPVSYTHLTLPTIYSV